MPKKTCAACGKDIDLDDKRQRHASVRLEFFKPAEHARKGAGSFELRRSYFCSQECFAKKVKGTPSG